MGSFHKINFKVGLSDVDYLISYKYNWQRRFKFLFVSIFPLSFIRMIPDKNLHQYQLFDHFAFSDQDILVIPIAPLKNINELYHVYMKYITLSSMSEASKYDVLKKERTKTNLLKFINNILNSSYEGLNEGLVEFSSSIEKRLKINNLSDININQDTFFLSKPLVQANHLFDNTNQYQFTDIKLIKLFCIFRIDYLPMIDFEYKELVCEFLINRKRMLLSESNSIAYKETLNSDIKRLEMLIKS